MQTQPQIFTLKNGIRVVIHQMIDTQLVHCGFTLNIGARDESIEEQGIAHFWEHMAFKGTKKRKAFHIINRLETVGGELNAFTTKEKICFHASVLKAYSDQAIELLTDITFHSTFPKIQIEKERNVILEEMAMYQDSPEDNILDEFDEIIYENHSLGRNILGTKKTVQSFEQSDFAAFIKKSLNTSEIVLSIVGNITIEKARKLADKYLNDIPSIDNKLTRKSFNEPTVDIVKKIRHIPLQQAQVLFGKQSYGLYSPKRLPLFLLNNVLGGPALNSRLNLSLREKYGFVYHVESNYQCYSDTGLFYINFATAPKQIKRSLSLVHKELNKLKEKPMGTLQLKRAKQQIFGQMAMAEENKSALMVMYGKALLNYGYIPTLDSVFKQIESITAIQLMEVANEVFDKDSFSHLYYLPDDH